MWRMARQPFAHRRFETHHPDRPGIILELDSYRLRNPRGVAATAFQLDQHWRSTRNKIQQLGQPRYVLVGSVKALASEHSGRSCLNSQCRSAQPSEIMIVKNDNLAIPG